ncbi:MAG TPA: TlpA disulfide reductase family protein [Longimicrobiales bacterium]|nr:TlpA disulfide reductase family protein [Longimicrobiales bacterium]
MRLPLTAALTTLLLAAPLTAQEQALPIGATPPTVTLPDLDGAAFDFGEVVGEKPVLVEFWATWCTICRALSPALTRAHDRYGDRVEFLVVAVGVAQTREQVRAHVARHPPAGRLLWDGEGAAVRAFEAPGTGYIVILDSSGAVAYTGTGVDQDLDAALRSVLEP